jgi:hypothetical protein
VMTPRVFSVVADAPVSAAVETWRIRMCRRSP